MLDRRRVLKALAGLFLSGSSTGAYAYAWEPTHQVVTRYGLTPSGWPKGRRLRLAVLSDLHIGGHHVPVKRVTQIVAIINDLKPDMVLLVGDFVASRPRRVSDPAMSVWAAELAKLRAPDGVFAVLGNHDWWHDALTQVRRSGPTEVALALRAVGIPVLENQALKLDTRAGPLWLAGLGDQIAFEPLRRAPYGVDNLPATLAQIADDGAPVIMMAHEPDIFPEIPARVGLTLSGHTHGGQIRLFGWSPVIPSNFGNRYAYGHIRENGRDLIVSAGIGTSKLPIRFGIPPEILLIELGDPPSTQAGA